MTKRKPLILCADDVPVNIKMLEVMLARDGYNVVTADNGQTALSMLTEQKARHCASGCDDAGS